MINRIVIDKFKGIDHLEIKTAGNFNVIIGENNIGKSTIFEAIHLWKMCYDNNLKKDKTGFYSSAKNIRFEGMEFIRVYHDEDLFPLGCDKKDAECQIIIEIEYLSNLYNLGFKIGRVSNINDAYLQVSYVDVNEFQRFSLMVDGIVGKNLASFIAINESRPIPNIIAKEPYMYKAQVIEKISKGKGYEVLRNKVIGHMSEVERHVSNVMGEDYAFYEYDKDNKTYISIKVNGKDIFSFGSGFLQLTEIFSSMEYVDPEINILLIDEPDAHLHHKLQRRLIDEFRMIPNSQLFIITHNERFLEQVSESEILFVSDFIKQKGQLSCLERGTKAVALENLKGCLAQVDQLRYASKIIAVEGATDELFLNNMIEKYERITRLTRPACVIIQMIGIDTLNSKLITYSRVLKSLIPPSCKWIILRDTDCVPCNRKTQAGNDDKKNMDTVSEVKVLFQEGYGIESTFIAEKNKLVKLLAEYYGISEMEFGEIESVLSNLNCEFERKVKDITNIEVHTELEAHFNRQKTARSGRIYDSISFADMLRQVTESNIQYIMTKKITNLYLKRAHEEIICKYPNNNPPLDTNGIFDFYYSKISSLEDMLDSHVLILNEIFSP